MDCNELKRLLKANGCKFVRHGKGSHEMWYSSHTNKNFTVPGHGEVRTGTCEAIKKQAGLK